MEQEEDKYQAANTEPQEDTLANRRRFLDISRIAILTELFDDSQLPDTVSQVLHCVMTTESRSVTIFFYSFKIILIFNYFVFQFNETCKITTRWLFDPNEGLAAAAARVLLAAGATTIARWVEGLSEDQVSVYYPSPTLLSSTLNPTHPSPADSSPIHLTKERVCQKLLSLVTESKNPPLRTFATGQHPYTFTLLCLLEAILCLKSSSTSFLTTSTTP